MTGKTVAMVGVLGAVGYYVFRDLFTIKDRLQVGDISLKSVTPHLLAADFNVNFPLINHGSISLPFDFFNGFLFYEDEQVGTIQINDAATVAARSTTNLPVVVSVYYLTLIDNLQTVIENAFVGQLPAQGTLKITGTIHSGGIMIPVSQLVY